MVIPIATTSITVLRVPVDAETDPLDPQAPADVVAVGIRAHISTPRGTEDLSGGSQEVVQWRLSCDTTDIKHTDQVRDDRTGEIYEVVWARPLGFVNGEGSGLEHTEAVLKQITGLT